MTKVPADIGELIASFERMFPDRQWTLAKRENSYLASSHTTGYVAKINANPDIIRSLDDTPELAFEAMMLRTMRRYNVKQS